MWVSLGQTLSTFRTRLGPADSGNDQAIDLVQLLGLLDEHNFGSQLFEPAAVRVEIALQGQDSDGHVDLILPEQQKIKIPQTGRDPGASGRW